MNHASSRLQRLVGLHVDVLRETREVLANSHPSVVRDYQFIANQAEQQLFAVLDRSRAFAR